jgi:Ca-activated chloride channel family protein
MVLIFWWMLPVWLGVIVAYWLTRYWLLALRKRTHLTTALPVAHTNRLTALPEYRSAFKRYQRLIRWATGLLSLSLLASILLTARPATVSIITPVQQNRDIMLCLDASGSVLREDTTLINRYSTLVNNFSGQRFGVTLFNSSAVTIIPLNDNYQLISEQLKSASQAFAAQKGTIFTELTNGTLSGFSGGTSLVSDGLTSCLQHMGTTQGRSQSIILATDNEINGTPIVNITQSVALARQRNIHIFAIDPGVSDPQLTADHTQLNIITKETGGAYYQLNDLNTVESIINTISQQDSQNFIGLPQPATNDNPKPFLYVAAVLTIASLAMLWRLEL